MAKPVRVVPPSSVVWPNWSGAPFERHLLPYDTTLHGAHAHLPQARVITHIHGGITDQWSDGYPEHWFSPDPHAPPNGLGGPAGNSLLTNHYNNQRGATLWYHDHAMAATRLNVYAGMAGFYLIRDAQEQSLDLPSGKYEVPLVLQDRSFYDDGELYYPNGIDQLPHSGHSSPHGGHDHMIDPHSFPSEASVVPHFFGNANLVNGVVWPYLEVEPRKYRFRLLNGANSRTYDLMLEAGDGSDLVFHQIGASGGLLPSVAERQQLLLSGGDRADVIVDFSQFNPGDEVFLRNLGPDDEFRYINTPADPETTGQVMKFRVIGLTEPDASSLPTDLPSIARYDPADAVLTRNLRLMQMTDDYGRPEFLLNGKHWSDPITEVVQMGELEIWELDNRTPMAHPIHLHMDHFQVLERVRRSTGEELPLGPEELGWVDTVLVGPGEIVRIMVKFEQFSGTFVWHCHLLEHEDSEMMRPFTIVARPIPEPASGMLLWLATGIVLFRWRGHRRRSRPPSGPTGFRAIDDSPRYLPQEMACDGLLVQGRQADLSFLSGTRIGTRLKHLLIQALLFNCAGGLFAQPKFLLPPQHEAAGVADAEMTLGVRRGIGQGGENAANINARLRDKSVRHQIVFGGGGYRGDDRARRRAQWMDAGRLCRRG